MDRREGLITYILVACTLLAGWASSAAETFSGSWTIHRSEEPGKVEFTLIHHQRGHSSSNESAWPIRAFAGLDLSKSGRQEAKFTITRDAGRFDCEGYLDSGEGAGVFHFFADSKFAAEMSALGFTGIDEEKQFSMAVLDVSLNFAKEMKGEHLQGLDSDKLIAFRIFNVDSEFIHELREAGITVTNCDKLVAFRIHGVNPKMVRFLHNAGYRPDEDQLIAMRIHGVTPEYISGLKSRGMQNLSIEQLVSLRIQGID
jgi:hypothetical protein